MPTMIPSQNGQHQQPRITIRYRRPTMMPQRKTRVTLKPPDRTPAPAPQRFSLAEWAGQLVRYAADGANGVNTLPEREREYLNLSDKGQLAKVQAFLVRELGLPEAEARALVEEVRAEHEAEQGEPDEAEQDHGRTLAEWYAADWNAMADEDREPPEQELEDVGGELAETGWLLVHNAKTGRWTVEAADAVEPVREQHQGQPLRYAAERSPKGGVTAEGLLLADPNVKQELLNHLGSLGFADPDSLAAISDISKLLAYQSGQ